MLLQRMIYCRSSLISLRARCTGSVGHTTHRTCTISYINSQQSDFSHGGEAVEVR